MKTDPNLDQISRDLVEWMDGWELLDVEVNGKRAWKRSGDSGHTRRDLAIIKGNLNVIREIEVEVKPDYLLDYGDNLRDELDKKVAQHGGVTAGAYAKCKIRLLALHKTLREEGEI